MKIQYKIAWILWLVIASIGYVTAQDNSKSVVQTIADKMDWYAVKKTGGLVFTHFDKNVYTSSENVWFTTYVLKKTVVAAEYNTFSVALIRNDDRKVFAEDQFVLQGEIGLGNIYIPDSIPPGAYSFAVYTNRLVNGVPEDVFIQPITIKPLSDPDLKIDIKIIDSTKVHPDSVKALVKVFTKDLKVVKNAVVSYTLGSTLGNTFNGKLKTNENGEVTITVPKSKITIDKKMLHVAVINGKEYKMNYVRMPLHQEKPLVNFFPEGGYLIDEVPAVVGIETKDENGNPMAAKGVLYENNIQLAEFETNNDGLGKFSVRPSAANTYTVKLQTAEEVVYSLPTILNEGVTLSLKKAVVNDTLPLIVKTNQIGKTVTVLLHNYNNIYANVQLVLKKKNSLIELPLTNIPKGIATVTILDSVGKPWAERLFFAHFNKRVNVQILVPKEKIQPREKISVNIKITNEKGLPEKSYVSLACVQDLKTEAKKSLDIESYFYLNSQIGKMPLKQMPMVHHANDNSFLETVLLIKGWRKYTWQEMLQAKAADTAIKLSSLMYTGLIKQLAKPVTSAYEMYVLREKDIANLVSDKSGLFQIPPSLLITNHSKKVLLNVKEKRDEQFSFVFNSPYASVTDKLRMKLPLGENDFSIVKSKKEELTSSLNPNIQVLQEVIVSTTKRCTTPSLRNACGDFVCKFGIINCPNHTFCSGPARNGMPLGNGQVYHCHAEEASSQNTVSVKGIYLNKTFYSVDYEVDGKDDFAYLTTIYWNHGLITDDKGEAQVIFPASDLVGRFRFVVNGITRTDKFAADARIIIAKKQND